MIDSTMPFKTEWCLLGSRMQSLRGNCGVGGGYLCALDLAERWGGRRRLAETWKRETPEDAVDKGVDEEGRLGKKNLRGGAPPTPPATAITGPGPGNVCTASLPMFSERPESPWMFRCRTIHTFVPCVRLIAVIYPDRLLQLPLVVNCYEW